MFKRILIPLDGSDCAMKAIPYATALTRKYKSTLILLRVADHGDLYPVAELPELYQHVYRTVLEECTAYLNSVASSLRTEGFDVVTEVVDGGNIPDVLLDRAKRHDADLIVMSTHGRSGLQRFLLGSVAERVVRHAIVPVMLVNGRSAEITSEA